MLEVPNDINALRALVFQQADEIEQLKSQLSELRRLHFGRRSEKVDRQIMRLESKLSDLEEEQIQRSGPL